MWILSSTRSAAMLGGGRPSRWEGEVVVEPVPRSSPAVVQLIHSQRQEEEAEEGGTGAHRSRSSRGTSCARSGARSMRL